MLPCIRTLPESSGIRSVADIGHPNRTSYRWVAADATRAGWGSIPAPRVLLRCICRLKKAGNNSAQFQEGATEPHVLG